MMHGLAKFKLLSKCHTVLRYTN